MPFFGKNVGNVFDEFDFTHKISECLGLRIVS